MTQDLFGEVDPSALTPGQVVRMRDRHQGGRVVDVTVTSVRWDSGLGDVRVFGFVDGVHQTYFHGADLVGLP